MADIIFDKVGKSYGAVPVIHDFDLTIKDHEFMVLVGPSGCGKSTALRMIAGLEDVTTGELSIGGRRVNEVEPRDRDVAIVLQSYALYPHKTVRQNIEFALKIRHVPRPEIDRLVAEAAGMLGLTPFLDRKPRALSGGQRQRVALGRAIVRRPSAFLFDEPLSNLDAELRVTTRAEIVNLRRKFFTTTVYVTHDQTEAMTMGDRIAVLAPLGDTSTSNLMQCGTPMELYRRPANVFVAQFIGSPKMNVYEMAVDSAAGQLVIDGQSLAMPEPYRRLLGERYDATVLVGMRPEHLSIEPSTAPADGNLSALVDLVEPLGDEAVVHLTFDGRPIVVKTTGGKEPPKVGEMVRLSPDPAAMHFFDPQSRVRLQGDTES